MLPSDRNINVLEEESVKWFYDSLELLVEDVRLDGKIDLYFDTGDMRAVVLGMYHFYDAKSGNFKWINFKDKSDTVLVHCLAAAGWLGKVSLLPPHRAEFLGLLRNDFNLGTINENVRQLARKFLREGFREIAAEDRFGDLEVETLMGLEGDKLIESFGGKAELAKEFFKLLQCIKGSWRTRLMAWDKYLALQERESFDPNPYMDEEIFLLVKNELDEIRPKFTISNFSDALAVAVLATQLRAFEENPAGRRLPILFDHAGDLHLAIKNAGVQDSLKYRGQYRSFSVLRDWQYFFLRATFGHRGQDPHDEKNLKEMLSKIGSITKGRAEMDREAVEALKSPAGDINKLIKFMNGFGFFGNVWLGSWRDDLGRVIAELERAKLLESDQIEAVEELQSNEIREKFREAKRELDKSIEQSVGLYHGITDLLKAIDARARKIRRGLTERNRDESDIILILGSFRFPFSSATHSEIAKVLSSLAGSKDTERRIEAQMKVISALSESRAGERLSDATLALLLGVLWATELDQEILDLAEGQHLFESDAGISPHQAERPLVFSLVWLAAIVRLTFGEEEKRYWPNQEGAPFLERLEDSTSVKRVGELRLALSVLYKIEHLLESKSGREKAILAVSIAYVQFHIFTSLCPIKSTRWPDDIPKRRAEDFLRRAADCAETAWQTPDLDEKRKIYALNQFVYYMAEGVRRKAESYKSLEAQFDKAAGQLAASEDKEGWHYRYDDSLARYYAIVGQERGDRVAWERGRFHIERALTNCFDDPIILAYYRNFVEQQEKWEAKQKRISD